MFRSQTTTRGQRIRRRRQHHELIVMAGLLAVTLVAVLAFAARASAATTVTVLNDRGVPQSGAAVIQPNGPYNGYHVLTGSTGQAVLSGIGAGTVLHVARGYLMGSNVCDATPEGPEGVAASVPSPVPSTMTITVPSDGLGSYQPQLSNYERGLIGLINQQRASQGIAPLYISLTLDNAADSYATAFPEYFSGITDSQAHCAVYGLGLRILDAGFPESGGWGASENIAWTSSAVGTFQAWMNSPPHKAAMLDPAFNAVGVANNGDKWIIDLANANPSDPGYARAQMTGDTGDPSLANSSVGSNGEGEDTELLDPHLRMRAYLQRHKLTVRLQAAATAPSQGTISVAAIQGKKVRRIPLTGQLQGRAHLGSGHWRLVAKFSPGKQSEYLLSSVSRTVVIGKYHQRH